MVDKKAKSIAQRLLNLDSIALGDDKVQALKNLKDPAGVDANFL